MTTVTLPFKDSRSCTDLDLYSSVSDPNRTGGGVLPCAPELRFAAETAKPRLAARVDRTSRATEGLGVGPAILRTTKRLVADMLKIVPVADCRDDGMDLVERD